MSMDEDSLRTQQINKELKKDFKEKSKVVKLLLLGTGESGKSTIVKQMKIINNKEKGNVDEYLAQEGLNQKTIIRHNVLDSISTLLDAAETFGYSYSGDKEISAARDRLMALLQKPGWRENVNTEYTGQVAKDAYNVWKHSVTQDTVKRSGEFQFLDSAPYFLNKAEQIAGDDYSPSLDDVLRARQMTVIISTYEFEVQYKGSFKFELIDVGGQRGERKKWIHYFEDVTAVLFIISLSDYNQVLYEDETTNRMQESERLFGQMLNMKFLEHTPFIVFFNKVDLFQEKLKVHPLTKAYKDYTGSQNYEEAVKFVKERFLSHNYNRDRLIRTFETTATDTDLVGNVLKSVQNIILQNILRTLFD